MALMMVYDTQSPTFGLCPSSKIKKKKNTPFWKLALFPSSGNKAPNLVDPLD